MNQRQILASKLALALILALFVIKGAILSILMPALQNPDEQIHYGTVQHLAEPTPRDWPIQEIKKRATNAADISTYGLSEEIIRSARSAQFDAIKFQKQNIQDFSDFASEEEILHNNWKRYIDTYPANTSGTKSIYYTLASWIERLFSDESIFTRIFLSRFIAVIFGLGVAILAYLIAKKIGLSEQIALLFTTLVAFQPMLSITGAQVNIDIALILAFSLFLYAGTCILKDGLNTKNAFLALFAALLGFFSKGPGIILMVMLYPLFAWGAYQLLRLTTKQFLIRLVGATTLLFLLAFLIVPKSYLAGITRSTTHSQFDSPLQSLGAYLDKTLTLSELRDTALSYWGQFGWLDSSIPSWSLTIIILISVAGFAGALWYIFSKIPKPEYLPARKNIVFFLGMIIALQLAIRFYDWRIFDSSKQILIGQPGRYFLPNISAHLLIIITGIGFLLRQENRFILAMKILTLTMILLQLHAIVNVIIPRYYL